MIFSKRSELAQKVNKWLGDNHAEYCTLNIITALDSMGLLNKKTPGSDTCNHFYAADVPDEKPSVGFHAAICVKCGYRP